MFNFYSKSDNEINVVSIYLKDIKILSLSYNNCYEIITEQNNIFCIHTDHRISEIENLDIFKQTKKNLEDKKNVKDKELIYSNFKI